MIILGKPYNKITKEDVQRLLEEKVRESKTLEYKQTLPGGSDQDKREFLADVSALANTMGGTIIFGIAEEKDEKGQNLGVPGGIVGLADFNSDKEIQRLESSIRSGLEPPLGTIGFHTVDVDGKPVLLLAVGKSLFAPHMVTFKNDSRFWMRGNSGRQQMSVDELRRMFLELDAWEAEAEKFRNERVAGAWKKRVPPGLLVFAPLLIHVAPLGRKGNLVSMRELAEPAQHFYSRLLKCSALGSFNLDGYLIHDAREQVSSYLQFFRNGSVEAYFCGHQNMIGKVNTLNAFWFEMQSDVILGNLFQVLGSFDIGFPFAVFLSVLGLKGLHLTPPNHNYFGWHERRFDTDNVLLPAVVFDNDEDMRLQLKSSFDILWQAAGWPECPEYLERLKRNKS